MEIKTAFVNSIPLLTLKGRWDGYGASLFEKEIQSLGEIAGDVVVDLSGVDYLSSSGIRSLLKLENALRPRKVHSILVKPSPFVSEVLNYAGLLRQFHVAASVDDALARASGWVTEVEIPFRQIIGGREHLLKRLPGGRVSPLDVWGTPPDISDRCLRTEDIAEAPLAELDFSFGIGGFGSNRRQALASLGEYVSIPGAAGVVPGDGNSFPDFLLTKEQPEATAFLAAAAGFSGPPSFLVEIRSDAAVTVADLAGGILQTVEAHLGSPFPALGIVILARPVELKGSTFKELDPATGRFVRTFDSMRSAGILIVGIVSGEKGLRAASGPLFQSLKERIQEHPVGEGRFFHGHAMTLTRLEPVQSEREIDRIIERIADSDLLQGTIHVEPETTLDNPRIWVYPIETIRSGTEKLLQIERADEMEFPEEWETITRRICRDARRVVLAPLHGGYMSKTFYVTSYDAEGRKMLPTVLKIGATELTRREEQAHRNYVGKYILNNAASIMGTASCGDWAGIRYNFVGITGPESRISWLRDHYLRRPIQELAPLFDAIFTNVLKPWHGQPRWENLRPYEEHTPLKLSPHILEDAERHLGISPDERIIECKELDLSLPNPYYFLKYEYPRRKEYSLPWYKSITHGDLNLQNILLDEKENIYIIDFSETRVRSAVADFARLEAQLRMQMTRLETEKDLVELLEFELGLAEPSRMSERPPLRYRGSDIMVSKAYEIIRMLRHYADRVTIFEENMVPYLFALLEWTYPFVSFRDASPLLMKFSAYSSAILCRKIIELS